MALDQTANFVRGSTSESVTNSQTTIGVNDANTYPNPTNGYYNLVLWDDANYPRPDQDPDVEIVRVTGRDTTNNTITVSRGQESTTAVSHPSGSALHLSPTSAFFADVASESQLFSGSHTDLTNISSNDHHSKYTDSEAQNAVTGSVDAANLVGGSGSAGQFLQTDGSALSWASVASGGVTHVQTSEPAYSEGATWLDPTTGIYRAAYDAGGGGDYHPVPPVEVTQEAATFTESNLTISHLNTEVSNGSIQLSGTQTSGEALIAWDTGVPQDMESWDLATFERTLSNETVTVDVVLPAYGSTTSRPSDGGSYDDSGEYGIAINPNKALAGVVATISSNAGSVTRLKMYRASDGTQLKSITGSWSSGDTAEMEINLKEGTKYNLIADDQGSTMTHGKYENASTPYTGTDLDIVDGASGHLSNPYMWNIVDVQGIVYNDKYTDITQNFDISPISNGKDPRLRANISRADTANNPTCDYLARRFVR